MGVWVVVVGMVVGVVRTQKACDLYDYLNSRTIRLSDFDISNMNFAYTDSTQQTYFSLCNPLDADIVDQMGIENNGYSFVQCVYKDRVECFGLGLKDIVMSTPSGVNKEIGEYLIYYKHPIDGLPIVIILPQKNDSIEDGALNNPAVEYSLHTSNPVEYEPSSYHNYSINVKRYPEIFVLDTYYFGPNHYWNSWLWAVIGASFMLSSACFHNYLTTSGRLSSFTFFIYFYVCYRLIDTFYSAFYTPNIIVATSSVIIFPGVIAYITTYLESGTANYIAFGILS